MNIINPWKIFINDVKELNKDKYSYINLPSFTGLDIMKFKDLYITEQIIEYKDIVVLNEILTKKLKYITKF